MAGFGGFASVGRQVDRGRQGQTRAGWLTDGLAEGERVRFRYREVLGAWYAVRQRAPMVGGYSFVRELHLTMMLMRSILMIMMMMMEAITSHPFIRSRVSRVVG